MEFLSQTSVNDNGDYSMTWLDQDNNKVVTEHNLFD